MRRLLLAAACVLLLVAPTTADPLLSINTGSGANDRTGDSVRDAFTKTMTAVNGLGTGAGISLALRGGTTRSLLAKLGDLPLTPQDVGATCNGTADDTNALNSLVGFLSEITISSGTCRITANATWAKGKVLRVAPGAGITVDAGKILTARLKVEAPLQRIFFGAGQVVGLKENRPEWWGAGNTYGYAAGRDDAPAFNAAMTSATASVDPSGIPGDGDRPSIRLNGYYYACTPIDIYPTQVVNIGIYGPGSLNGGGTINACPTFTGAALFQIHGISKAGGAYTGFDLEFRDFQLTCAGSNAPIGMSWVPEGAGYGLIGGLQPASVTNVAVTGCPTNFKYQNTRLVKFDRVSAWGSNKNSTVGLWITSSDNQSFTGDSEFINFNTALCGSSFDNALCSGITNIKISADGAVGAGSANSERIKGIRFLLGLANAEKSIDIQAMNGAFIGDIWILPGTQIDGFACNTMNIAAGNSSGNTAQSVVDSIYVLNTYNRGRNTGCPAIVAAATGSGAVRSLFVTGNWFANNFANVGNFFNVQGLHLDGNTVYDPQGAVQDAAFSISATKDFTANGNILTRSGTSTFVNLINLGSGTDGGVAVNNVCNGVTSGCVANNTGSSNVIATPNVTLNR